MTTFFYEEPYFWFRGYPEPTAPEGALLPPLDGDYEPPPVEVGRHETVEETLRKVISEAGVIVVRRPRF